MEVTCLKVEDLKTSEIIPILAATLLSVTMNFVELLCSTINPTISIGTIIVQMKSNANRKRIQ